jgi:biopolymer transport protein ExbD
MRRHIASLKNEDEEGQIDLTPMLDVVFIMLIFFIVTASFIRESGLESKRPDQDDTPTVTDEEGAILVMINGNGDIYVDNQPVDIRQVRPRIAAMHAENDERPLVIQVHQNSKTGLLVAILDQANLANIDNVSIVEL